MKNTLKIMFQTRQAQQLWATQSIDQRISCMVKLRRLLAHHANDLAQLVQTPARRNTYETLCAEILPLTDACKFATAQAKKILRPRTWTYRHRPLWMYGNQVEIHREPWGLIMLIGPSNYPLFLLGVQFLHALLMGNAVILKPGAGGFRVIQKLVELAKSAGIPADLMILLEEDPSYAQQFLGQGVDKVFLTGALPTGQNVLKQLAEHIIPATMELSGCDAVIVLQDADLELVTKSLVFGLSLNSSATCMAPRRVYATQAIREQLEKMLVGHLASSPPVSLSAETAEKLRLLLKQASAQGFQRRCGEFIQPQTVTPFVLTAFSCDSKTITSDLFAPVITFFTIESMQQARDDLHRCAFRLSVSIFGSAQAALLLAKQLPAGVVLINDIIAGSADPRAPFGGRGRSGYGVTRGAEGLLEMMQLKTIIRKSGNWRPYLSPTGNADEALMVHLIKLLHINGLRLKLSAAWRLCQLGFLAYMSKSTRRVREQQQKSI